MLKRGRREIEEYGAGDYVRIKIPRVDKRRLGGKSLVCKVVEVGVSERLIQAWL